MKMVRPPRVAVCLVIALPIIMAASGCLPELEDPPPRPKPVSNWTIEDARAFQDFPLYWLGESYEGLQLTYMGSSTDGDEVKHATFWYGESKFVGGEASGSWNPPLEVDIQPYCGFPPEEFLSYAEEDYGVESEISEVEIRGTGGYLERYSSDEAALQVWTGASAIHLYTYQTELDIEQAARDLIPVAEDIGATLKPLPPPTTTEC